MKKVITLFVSILALLQFNISSYAITDNDALEKFKEAAIVSEWFGPLCDYNGSEKLSHKNDFPNAIDSIIFPVTVNEEGKTTHKVYAECCYCTKIEMIEYLRTIFSDNLTDRFMNTDAIDTERWKNGAYKDSQYVFGEHKRFEEIDGVLYCFNNSYQEGNIKAINVSIVENNDKKTVIDLEYEVWIGSAESPTGKYNQLYTLVKNSNGTQVFNEFPIQSELWKLRVKESTNNPQTADAPVIAVCSLAISAAAAVIFLKKKKTV